MGLIKGIHYFVVAFIFMFYTCICLIITELLIRNFIGELPTAVLIFLHTDLKYSIPEVNKALEDSNPWASGRVRDEDFGWTFKKNYLHKGENEEGEAYEIVTSDEGLVTPDSPLKDEKQLILLGDSFLATYYVKEAIPWTIRRELNLPVYSLAVVGWGPESYRRAFEKLACDRKSAGVVPVFSFVNDVTDVDNWQRWERTGKKISFIDWIWNENPDKEVINTADHWMDSHSVLWNWLKFAASRFEFSFIEESAADFIATEIDSNLVEFVDSDSARKFTLRFNPGYMFSQFDVREFLQGGRYWKYMEAYFDSLGRLEESIHSCGSKMLLIWIPSKERVYFPLLEKDLAGSYIRNRSRRIDGYEVSLRNFTQENGLPFLDLTPELILKAKEGKKLYFTNDGHLNSEGNKIVGEIASMFISEQLKNIND